DVFEQGIRVHAPSMSRSHGAAMGLPVNCWVQAYLFKHSRAFSMRERNSSSPIWSSCTLSHPISLGRLTTLNMEGACDSKISANGSGKRRTEHPLSGRRVANRLFPTLKSG